LHSRRCRNNENAIPIIGSHRGCVSDRSLSGICVRAGCASYLCQFHNRNFRDGE
jgi:hypothetical protein